MCLRGGNPFFCFLLLPTTYYLLPTYDSLFATRYLPLTTCHLLLAPCFLAPCSLLLAPCFPPCCLLLTTYHLPFSLHCFTIRCWVRTGCSPPMSRRRFAFVNVWRPISIVESKPLACVDARTVAPEELIPLTVHHADQSAGGIYFATHRPCHGWHYFPSMTPDEVLLVKQWDSHGGIARGRTDMEEGCATFALHSAFAEPVDTAVDVSPRQRRDRESIEVRMVVVY